MTLLVALTLSIAVHCQEPAAGTPAPPPTADSLLERYRRLGSEQRSTVVRGIERRLQRDGDETLQRIVSRQRGTTSYPQQPQGTWLDQREYAPAAAARQLVSAGTDLHRNATRGMRPFVFLTDLAPEVVHDWSIGKAVRTGKALIDDERFANVVRGYAPGSDHAVAQILEALDTDPDQRRLGAYFQHLYADRNGAVFAGVTLFEAWYAGSMIEMPDTEVVAFARDVLQTRALVAPLPADRRRERVYEKIKAGFASHREHRTLRLVLAATFVAADPIVDPIYEPLVRRGHWLWASCEYDLAKLLARWPFAADRSELLAKIDAAMQADPNGADRCATARQRLLDLAAALRAVADQELGRAGA
jgi:hypothetical protein